MRRNKIQIDGKEQSTWRNNSPCKAETLQGIKCYEGLNPAPYNIVQLELDENGDVISVNYCPEEGQHWVLPVNKIYGRQVPSIWMGKRYFFRMNPARWVSPAYISEIEGLAYPSIELVFVPMYDYEDKYLGEQWTLASGFSQVYSGLAKQENPVIYFDGVTINLETGNLEGEVPQDSKLFEEWDFMPIFRRNLLPTKSVKKWED